MGLRSGGAARRPRWWTIIAAGFLAALVFAAPAAGQEDFTPRKHRQRAGEERIVHPKEIENAIFKLTNDVRRKHHLDPVDKDQELAAAARDHSDDMLRRDFFSHENPDGFGPRERVPAYSRAMARAGENIYGSHGLDFSDPKLIARIVVDGWMASPGHRVNLLNAGYTSLGVGVSVKGTEIRATQVFGLKRKGK